MSLVDECDVSLEGRDTLVLEQNAYIEKLKIDLKEALNIEGPLTGIDLLSTVSEETAAGHITSNIGTFIVRKDFVIRYIEDSVIRYLEDSSL